MGIGSIAGPRFMLFILNEPAGTSYIHSLISVALRQGIYYEPSEGDGYSS